MSDFDSPGVVLDSPVKRRSAATRFADLGERLSRTFSSLDRVKGEPPAWEPSGDAEYPALRETALPWEELQPPFPLVRHGYQPSAVDDYITELEQELEELRSRTPEQRAVAQEIDRIGTQTASILRVAHDKAQEVTRDAQVQADRCVADAAANALAVTENANRRVRELDSETDSIWHERARLIEDVRHVASALAILADDAAGRYPEEQEKTRSMSAMSELVSEEPEAG